MIWKKSTTTTATTMATAMTTISTGRIITFTGSIVVVVASLSIHYSIYFFREYQDRYQKGRIISFYDYIKHYWARRRMQKVIQSLLPLWESRYDLFYDNNDNDNKEENNNNDDNNKNNNPTKQTTTTTNPPLLKKKKEPFPIKFQSSDVIVFAPPKCGTTWVTHICYQISVRGADITFYDQDDAVPWIERLGTPYLEGIQYKIVENDPPSSSQPATPRVFKSHLEWKDQLSLMSSLTTTTTLNGAAAPSSYKQIWVFRDCVDMMISVSHFLPTLWGININDDSPLTEEEMCSFLLNAGDVESALTSLVSVWEYLQQQQNKNNNTNSNDTTTTTSNLLVLFYENIIENHKGTVERIAKFMNMIPPLSSDELNVILQQTTKEGMLQHHQVFACRIQAQNAYRARGIVSFYDETQLVGKVRRQRRRRRHDDENHQSHDDNSLESKTINNSNNDDHDDHDDHDTISNSNKSNKADIVAAVDRAWKYIVEPKTGFKDYTSMRQSMTNL